MESKKLYKKKGQVLAVNAIVALVVGVGVAVMVLIFVGALGGQTYNLVEPDILNISDATIRTHVTNSITSAFDALEQTGDYLPLVVLAVIISLVLTLVLSFTSFAGGARGGSAL